jgi:hypothetical protein
VVRVAEFFISDDGAGEPTLWLGSPEDDRPVAVIAQWDLRTAPEVWEALVDWCRRDVDLEDADELGMAFLRRMSWSSVHWAPRTLDPEAAVALAKVALEQQRIAVNAALEEAAQRILRSLPADHFPRPGRLNREHDKAARGAMLSAIEIVRDGVRR